MLDNRKFWQFQMLVLTGLYLTAAILAARGDTSHWTVRLSVIVLAVHVLEVPLAFFRLRGRNPQALRVIPPTLLFGLIFWVPASRGVFAVRA